jgi:hypothetical protein
LTCVGSPEWQMVTIVEQLVEWMSGRGNWSIGRNLPLPLCPS